MFRVVATVLLCSSLFMCGEGQAITGCALGAFSYCYFNTTTAGMENVITEQALNEFCRHYEEGHPCLRRKCEECGYCMSPWRIVKGSLLLPNYTCSAEGRQAALANQGSRCSFSEFRAALGRVRQCRINYIIERNEYFRAVHNAVRPYEKGAFCGLLDYRYSCLETRSQPCGQAFVHFMTQMFETTPDDHRCVY